MSELKLSGIAVSIGERSVIEDLSLAIAPGEVHVIMGRNGSGKSSLTSALSAKPGYEVTAGSAMLGDVDLLALDATGRAKAGLFVASQYPLEIQGLSNGQFLRAMANNMAKVEGRDPWSAGAFLAEAKACCARLGIPPDFLQRSLNAGMSGGERKRNELLQLRFFQPKIAILDEIDSGLDVDAWSQAVDFVKQEQERSGFGLLLISHYAKMAERFEGAQVHILSGGRISKSGGVEIARQLEERGFEEGPL